MTPLHKDYFFMLLLITLGIILGYFVSATFYFNSYEAKVEYAGECKRAGFYNLDINTENISLKEKLFSCEEKIANCRLREARLETQLRKAQSKEADCNNLLPINSDANLSNWIPYSERPECHLCLDGCNWCCCSNGFCTTTLMLCLNEPDLNYLTGTSLDWNMVAINDS